MTSRRTHRAHRTEGRKRLDSLTGIAAVGPDLRPGGRGEGHRPAHVTGGGKGTVEVASQFSFFAHPFHHQTHLIHQATLRFQTGFQGRWIGSALIRQPGLELGHIPEFWILKSMVSRKGA